jgi:copper oxidase (laccase) domain-containing protein
MTGTVVGALVETFPALSAVLGLRHGFVQRVPGLDVTVDRELALSRLEKCHAAARTTMDVGEMSFVVGEQVHGANVASVNAATRSPVAKVDGLITADKNVCLGVYVADCCAVYLVDPGLGVIALLHSGRKGTELGIVKAAIERMVTDFGCHPRRIIAQLSPCIRPPHYEVDFAAEIVGQCRAAGVKQIADDGVCTACHPEKYYSYRAEKGRTGRMLALLAFDAAGN